MTFNDNELISRDGAPDPVTKHQDMKSHPTATLPETATPSTIANVGQMFYKSSGELFLLDAAGNVHLVHGDAFSGMWYHGASADTVTIGAEDAFIKITSFENIASEDDLANLVSNTSNNEMTVGANGAGSYALAYHVSISVAGGASKKMVICPGIELATPIDVTAATNATPIVVTSVAHGLLNGDMVEIVGATTNTAANGSWIVASKTNDTFTLIALDGANSVGNGVYDASSGDVTIVYPGNLVMQRTVSQADIGVGGAHADFNMLAGDKIGFYVANLDDTSDLKVIAISGNAKRIGD